jgi:hypothetical protein
MFTDMLAEMRAYGEGFIVADQIPTKLAPEIVKNSNVKILHRLVAPDDRAVVASAINLDEAQSRHLAALPPGTAIVHDDRMGAAVLVRMSPLTFAAGREVAATASRPADLTYLHRNGGCQQCPAPCTLLDPARRVVPEAELDARLEPCFTAVLRGDAEAAWGAWDAWRAEWLELARRSGAGAAAYCAAAQSGRRWADRVVTAGAAAVGEGAHQARRLLTVERCARQLARLCAAWGDAGALDERARRAFEAVHRELAGHLTERPPRELPGCAGCPARCRMLHLVAPVLPGVRSAVSARATGSTSVDVQLRGVTSISEPAFQSALGSLPSEEERRAFLYCVVTTATAGANPGPAALLAALRTDGAGG